LLVSRDLAVKVLVIPKQSMALGPSRACYHLRIHGGLEFEIPKRRERCGRGLLAGFHDQVAGG